MFGVPWGISPIRPEGWAPIGLKYRSITAEKSGTAAAMSRRICSIICLVLTERWVILSKRFPWEEIDREYQEHFKSSEGQAAIPSCLAFGALYIQAEEGYTDAQTRRNIQENPYLQYFCGFECYTTSSPFDASLSLLGNDLYRKLLVIQELCRQQWDMYVRKSHQTGVVHWKCQEMCSQSKNRNPNLSVLLVAWDFCFCRGLIVKSSWTLE